MEEPKALLDNPLNFQSPEYKKYIQQNPLIIETIYGIIITAVQSSTFKIICIQQIVKKPDVSKEYLTANGKIYNKSIKMKLSLG